MGAPALRERGAWHRHQGGSSDAEQRAWARQTESWVGREIRSGSASGRYLAARRARVLAALGMTFTQALSKLTYQRRGDEP